MSVTCCGCGAVLPPIGKGVNPDYVPPHSARECVASLRARCEAAEAEVEQERAHLLITVGERDKAEAEVERLRLALDEATHISDLRGNEERVPLSRALAAERSRDEAREALREIMRVLDHPPGITFNQQSKANVEAWLIANRVLSGEKEGAPAKDDLGNAYRVARESCEAERAMGNGGCGCCTRCCKEANDRALTAKAEGFRAGAEWMREQARSWVHSCTDMERMTIARWDSVLDALPVSPPAPEATHRCNVCEARWRDNHDGTWTLVSAKAGACCDNQPMRDQIEPLRNPKANPACDNYYCEGACAHCPPAPEEDKP